MIVEQVAESSWNRWPNRVECARQWGLPAGSATCPRGLSVVKGVKVFEFQNNVSLAPFEVIPCLKKTLRQIYADFDSRSHILSVATRDDVYAELRMRLGA